MSSNRRSIDRVPFLSIVKMQMRVDLATVLVRVDVQALSISEQQIEDTSAKKYNHGRHTEFEQNGKTLRYSYV